MSLDVTHFFGTFTPRLDEKSRLILPAKFRARLDRGIVLTPGQENCIYGWTPETFSEFTARLSGTPFTNRDARTFFRMFFSATAEEMPDKQGRIMIPPVLRQWAGLERDVTVVGALDRLEIWDTERWNDFQAEQAEPFAAMSEEITPNGF